MSTQSLRCDGNGCEFCDQELKTQLESERMEAAAESFRREVAEAGGWEEWKIKNIRLEIKKLKIVGKPFEVASFVIFVLFTSQASLDANQS